MTNPRPGQKSETITRVGVILTALSTEYAEVRKHLVRLQEVTHEKGTVYEIGEFQYVSGIWEIAIAEIGAGNDNAAVEAERAIQHFRPDLIMFVGVAGGVKDVSIGDVVVATKIYGYESGKAKERFLARPVVGNSSYALVQRARAEARGTLWRARIDGGVTGSVPQVCIGPIAAGEAVVSSRRSAIYKFLRDNYSDTLAVEMEGRGFLSAAHANSNVRAIVIRGISDLITGKAQSDASGTQSLASRNASAFAFEILAKFYLQEPQAQEQSNSSNSRMKKPKRPRPLRRQLLYELKFWDAVQERLIGLNGWRLLESPQPHPIGLSEGIFQTGSDNSTTFHRAPQGEIKNCSVECELRIVDAGGDETRWAGIRLRGFHDDIQFGYLVYLRAKGTVELYRARMIIGGAEKPIKNDTANDWTHIRVDLRDSKIEIWVNGKRHITKYDKIYGEKGCIYLHTFGVTAQFKNFKVYGLSK